MSAKALSAFHLPIMKTVDKSTKRVRILEEQLRQLRDVSLRVWRKYGHDDNGVSLGYSEWSDVKTECDNVDTMIGKN